MAGVWSLGKRVRSGDEALAETMLLLSHMPEQAACSSRGSTLVLTPSSRQSASPRRGNLILQDVTAHLGEDGIVRYAATGLQGVPAWSLDKPS